MIACLAHGYLVYFVFYSMQMQMAVRPRCKLGYICGNNPCNSYDTELQAEFNRWLAAPNFRAPRSLLPLLCATVMAHVPVLESFVFFVRVEPDYPPLLPSPIFWPKSSLPATYLVWISQCLGLDPLEGEEGEDDPPDQRTSQTIVMAGPKASGILTTS